MANRNLLDPRRAPATPPEAEQGFVRELRQDVRHGAGRTEAPGDRTPDRPRRRLVPALPARIPRKALMAALPVVVLLAAAALLLPGRFAPASGEDAARTAGADSAAAGGAARSAAPPASDRPTRAPTRAGGTDSPAAEARPGANAPASGPDQIRSAVASAASGAAETIQAAASAVGNGIAAVVGGIQERAASVADGPDQKADTAARPGNTSARRGADAPPRSAAPRPRRAPRPIGEERTVVWGDSLRYISKEHYGDEMLWPLIWDYNKQRAKREGQNMENPDLIYPGWKFIIPERE